MDPISNADIRRRIERDNFWWQAERPVIPEAESPRRAYFPSFKALAMDFNVRRATVLLGPRRVGKTFMLKQLIHEAIESGFSRKSILFSSIDAPVLSGMSLEDYIGFMPEDFEHEKKIVIFDEIQYLRGWETHLKDLVDTFPNIKFIATGSAAAALRLKSNESGAGRFSDFMLPPLTFYEFLMFLGEDEDLVSVEYKKERGIERRFFSAKDITKFNERFIDYLNFGGYPEAVLNKTIRSNSEQFIRNDIIDKVLLKDLPSLYGIHEIQELNKLFSFLAYNAGNEASLENICQGSGITKPTIRRYIEYLESAFLIIKVGCVDDLCKTMKRERNFKIYLNNPSMRAALFSPVESTDSQLIGHLTESAIFSQWQHAPNFRMLRYARWRNEGEVDIVYVSGPRQTPSWVGEIKWSDRAETNRYEETKSLSIFTKNHPSIRNVFLTTKTFGGEEVLNGRPLSIWPSALYCYMVGRNITTNLQRPLGIEAQAVETPNPTK